MTMLLDTATIYYSRRPMEGYRLTDFAAGLSLLMKTETERDESDWSDQLQEEEGGVDFSEGGELESGGSGDGLCCTSAPGVA
mgnify:CR=1 FL=1